MPLLLQIIARVILTGIGAFLAYLGYPAVTQDLEFSPQVTREDLLIKLPSEFPKFTFEIGTTTIQIEDAVEFVIGTTTPSVVITPSTETHPKPTIEISIPITPPPPIANEIPEQEIFDFGIWDIAQKNAENTSVKIVCLSNNGETNTMSVGSGVIIDERGVILTNAHVAALLYLKDFQKNNFMNCTANSKKIISPAQLRILFISPDWAKENAFQIFSDNPRGNGDKDFALIYATNGNGVPIYSDLNFAFINQSSQSIEEKIDIYLSGFPVTQNNFEKIRNELELFTDDAQVKQVFTLMGNEIDVFETTKNDVGWRGASGGGIWNTLGEIIGIIVAVKNENGNSGIQAITSSYINREIERETGKNISQYLNSNLKNLSEDFEKEKGNEVRKLIETAFASSQKTQ